LQIQRATGHSCGKNAEEDIRLFILYFINDFRYIKHVYSKTLQNQNFERVYYLLYFRSASLSFWESRTVEGRGVFIFPPDLSSSRDNKRRDSKVHIFCFRSSPIYHCPFTKLYAKFCVCDTAWTLVTYSAVAEPAWGQKGFEVHV
jgi:hypothetical protein